MLLNESEIQALIKNIVGYDVETINSNKFIEGLKYLKGNFNSFNDIFCELKELKLAFAALGITYNDLISNFNQEALFSLKSFIEQMKNDGLKMNEKSLSKVCEIVFGEKNEMEGKKILENIFGMIDEVFITNEAEKEFDQEISKIMRKK